MNTTEEQSILLVDDNQTNLQVMLGYLETAGFQVLTARNGEMGVKRAVYAQPDLILLDVMMPGIDGFETCQLLKENDETKDIPTIFMTALNDVESKLKGFEVGGVDYITKPIEELEVLARVRTHLTISALRKELEERNRELARLVNVDALTGITNRRYFDDFLQQEWKRLKTEGSPLSLIMIDIDYFKLYNDAYGHQAGDECLRQVAHVFQSAAMRSSDLAARYGGEEFAILLPNTDEAGVEQVARSIQVELDSLRLPHQRSLVSSNVTCSMGGASTVPMDSGGIGQLVSAADRALYLAKERGRNQYIFDLSSGRL